MTTQTDGPSTSESNGRDDQGRFLPGKPGGPGNPHAAAVGACRSVMAASMTADDLQEVFGTLVREAKAGEPWAVKELLNRCLGRPTQAVAIEGGALTWPQMVAALEAAQTATEEDGHEEK